MKAILGLSKSIPIAILVSLSWHSTGEEVSILESNPIFHVSKTKSPIIIDGHGNESAWQKAESRSLDHFRKVEKPSDRQKSEFRMLWDEENLYLLFECKDRFLTAHETQRDGKPYLDDCAEIFLIPAPAPLDMHFGFEINLYKASNDFVYLHDFYKGANTVIKAYDPEYQVEVSIDGTLNDNSDEDRSWTMEIALPFKLFSRTDSLSPAKTGNRWAFQAIRQERNDLDEGRRVWSTLFPIDPNTSGVHDSNDFGLLEFTD